MKARIILTFFTALLCIFACSDSGGTNPITFESDQLEASGTLPGTVFKQLYAGQIAEAPKGTYFECISAGIIAATGGEDLFGSCQVWNDFGSSYTLEVQGPHRFVLSEASTVQITNPVGISYRNEEEGHWVKVTGDITVICNVVSVRGNGSAGLSTSVRIDIRSGFSEN